MDCEWLITVPDAEKIDPANELQRQRQADQQKKQEKYDRIKRIKKQRQIGGKRNSKSRLQKQSAVSNFDGTPRRNKKRNHHKKKLRNKKQKDTENSYLTYVYETDSHYTPSYSYYGPVEGYYNDLSQDFIEEDKDKSGKPSKKYNKNRRRRPS